MVQRGAALAAKLHRRVSRADRPPAAPDLSAEAHILVGLLIAAYCLIGTKDIEDMAAVQAIVTAAQQRAEALTFS